jgi:putative inorganic carbon (HCO3(-)) transporter
VHRLQSLTHLVTDPSPTHSVELLGLLVLAVVALRVLARIDITKLVVAGVVLEVFSGNWKLIPIPVPIDRALLAVALVVLVLRDRRSTTDRRIVLQPIHFLLLAVAVYVFGNGLWAGTILHSYGLYTWLDRLGVVPFLMFTLAPLLFGTERQRNVLLVGIVGLGVYLGIEGLAEGLGVHALEVPGYIANQSLGITPGRTRGPFLASDAMGLALFDCAVFSTIALSKWRAPLARLVCYGVMGLAAVDIFFTLTRAVWLGAVVATLAAMIWHPRLRRFVPAVIVAGVAAIGVLLAAVPGLSAKVSGRLGTQSSVWDRYNTNDAAVRALLAHPIFGIGWQTFETTGISYLRQAATYPLTGEGLEVHNVFLSHLAELGIVGGVAWTLALLTGIGGAIVRRGPPELWLWRIGLLAMFVAFVVAANLGPLSYPFPNLILWLTAGIVAADRNSRPADDALHWEVPASRTEVMA